MWCWHRIKEQESGLCPACRTGYGDDPHEFSAVDMEEVVKANKEKLRAEKLEKERLRAMREQEKRENLANYAPTTTTTNFAAALSSGGLGGTTSFGQFDGADLLSALGGSSSHNKAPPEPPKDRSTLATMRVIRRNLVYAVGLPPNIASEEILRKPAYFGQYGKISKIVVNKNHNPGDPRRASASAYVTFAHKVRSIHFKEEFEYVGFGGIYFRAAILRSWCSFYTDWGIMECLRGGSFTFGYCTIKSCRPSNHYCHFSYLRRTLSHAF